MSIRDIIKIDIEIYVFVQMNLWVNISFVKTFWALKASVIFCSRPYVDGIFGYDISGKPG